MSLQAFQAAQITVGYCGLYSMTMLNQSIQKQLLIRQAKQEGKVFERYKSPAMLTHDRLPANFIEWMPAFLGPLWCMAATDTLSDQSVKVAWTYVALRVLYVGLIAKYGVHSGGRNVSLWISTFPGYGCLLYLLVAAVRGVF